MKFDEFWEKYKKLYALEFKNRSDFKAGWYAALEYGAQNKSDNTQRVKFTYHNSPYYVGYKCDCPGDMTGEYIRVGYL